MSDEGWLDDYEQRAWRRFQMMFIHLNGALARSLSQTSDLSYADYVVLVVLTDEEDDRLRITELARRLDWEKSRLSHHLSRMVKRGLVTKRICDEDRRGAYVEVTLKGQAAIAAAAPDHVRSVREYFIDVATPEQLAVVDELAQAVLARLEVDEAATLVDSPSH